MVASRVPGIVRQRAQLALDTRDSIGEQPLWDAVKQRLLWCDNAIGVIHEAKSDQQGGWYESRRWTLGKHIGAAIPRAAGGLVVMIGAELVKLDDDGNITPFARFDADPNLTVPNDARCDARGRLWAGTFGADLLAASGNVAAPRGALYRIDADGTVATMLEDVTLANGLDWSPDSSTLYFIDSHLLSVDAFDFDLARGEISNRRNVVTINRGEGMPDGMTVDSEGCLWVAVLGSGEVRRYTPDGVELSRVEISASGVTSCGFGGPDRADLFITSASVRLPAATIAMYGFTVAMAESAATAPGAGGLFTCRPGVAGQPLTPFAG